MISEIISVVNIMITVFWSVTSCSVKDEYR